MKTEAPEPNTGNRGRRVLVATISFLVAMMIAQITWGFYAVVLIVLDQAALLQKGMTPVFVLGLVISLLAFVGAYRWCSGFVKSILKWSNKAL